jgi:hypothetical protein
MLSRLSMEGSIESFESMLPGVRDVVVELDPGTLSAFSASSALAATFFVVSNLWNRGL